MWRGGLVEGVGGGEVGWWRVCGGEGCGEVGW